MSAQPKTSFSLAAEELARLHVPVCNYWTERIGAPGCICVRWANRILAKAAEAPDETCSEALGLSADARSDDKEQTAYEARMDPENRPFSPCSWGDAS